MPAALADLEPGEAVLVEFGRRQALGVVLGRGEPTARGIAAKPIVDRVRADGPLLPPLTLRAGALDRRPLSRAAGTRPPGDAAAGAARAARAGRRAGARDAIAAAAGTADDPADRDLLDQLERGPRPVRDLAGPDGRAGLLRRLRALAADGRVSLEWTLLGAGAGPRYERWIRLTAAGRERRAASRPANDRRAGRSGRARSRCSRSSPPRPTGGACRRRTSPAGTAHAALAGLVRRGLAEADVRERPRRPLAGRPVGLRGGRPAGSDLLPAQAEARRRSSGRDRRRAIRARSCSTA